MNPFSLAFITICALMFSCSSRDNPRTQSYDLIHSYAKEMEKTHEWLMWDRWVRCEGDLIKRMEIAFFDYQNIDIQQARILLVQGAQSFLEKINSSPKVQSHLSPKLFTYKEIDFHLSFFLPQGEFVHDDHIATVFLINGRSSYHVFKGSRLQKIYDEPYEETLRIVNSLDGTPPGT